MKKWLALIALVIGLLPAVVLAQGTGDIAIVGRVTNGTPGGPLPVGEPVTLQFFQETHWTAIYTATLAADGTFRFADFTADTGASFVTHIRYRDVHYYSEPATLEGTADIEADIEIFEPTADPAAITIEQVHLFIVPQGEQVRIAEYYLIGNSGDRTFVGTADADGARTTLTFPLPPEATNLRFNGPGLGERFIGDESGFADTQPIPPGSATIDVDFSYDLPYREGLRVERRFGAPVSQAALIINSETVGLAGEGLTPGGMMNTQMGPSASYSVGPLAEGEPLAFTFVPQTQRPAPAPAATGPAGPRPRNPAQETGLGIVALALGGLASYLLWRSTPAAPLPPAWARPLIAEIVALDTDFAAGKIEAAAYRQQRAALKEHLRAQLQREGEGVGE